MLTPRWFYLALVVPLLLLLGGILPFLVPVAIFYAAALVGATWLDRRAAGNADQFRVKRTHDPKLSLGVANPIQLVIESRSPRTLTLISADEPPLSFTITGSAKQTTVYAPHETRTLSYSLTPVQRGDYRFGDLNLRWISPLRLYVRQAVIPAAVNVKVYPNLYEIRQFDLLVRQNQLAEMGLRSVRLRGEGTAFESLRDYTPDDAYRSINWKATARRGKPISTDYEPERSQRVILMLDVGRTMRSPVPVPAVNNGTPLVMAKVDFVVNSVLLLSYVASRTSDQVGLLVFADQVKQFIAPAPGGAHFQKLLEAMYALQSEPVEADYKQSISYLKAHFKKRSFVILFTDLSGARASESLLAHMPRLAPQHLPLLVTIRDPILDQEAGQTPTTSDAVYRRAVAEQLIDERRLLLNHLQRQGVFTL
ncbi:MAG: DUF58 domain-containing protein, partial [Chloroflexota bacterium]